MLCLASLIILVVLAIFSAAYRPLAKEAFLCVFRKVTLRPCEMEFGEKMKMRAVGRLADYSPRAAKLVNKHAQVLAWAFVILSLTSLAYTSWGVYNFIRYGSCSPENPQNCILKDLSYSPNCP